MAVVSLGVLGTSCTTMYDSYGRPQQVVTPEGAAMAAIAAGVVGYALADDDGYRHRGHRGNGGYGGFYGSPRGGYGGGYCR